MDFETVLRKFVRLPWEVWRGDEHCKDKEISDYVTYQALAGDAFKQEPRDDRERAVILQSIANVMVVALTTQSGEALNAHNRFQFLEDEEKRFLFSKLAINPVEHDSVLQIVKKESTAVRLASYIAAAYAFTTHTFPFVVNFEKLSAIAYQSLRDGSQEEKSMRRAGLLILTDLGIASKTNETAYSFLLDMLNRRAAVRRMNMFFDTPHGAILTKMQDGRLPTRQEVTETYLKMFPLTLRLDSHLVGAGVHMPLIDRSESISDERRKATVV